MKVSANRMLEWGWAAAVCRRRPKCSSGLGRVRRTVPEEEPMRRRTGKSARPFVCPIGDPLTTNGRRAAGGSPMSPGNTVPVTGSRGDQHEGRSARRGRLRGASTRALQGPARRVGTQVIGACDGSSLAAGVVVGGGRCSSRHGHRRAEGGESMASAGRGSKRLGVQRGPTMPMPPITAPPPPPPGRRTPTDAASPRRHGLPKARLTTSRRLKNWPAAFLATV